MDIEIREDKQAAEGEGSQADHRSAHGGRAAVLPHPPLPAASRAGCHPSPRPRGAGRYTPPAMRAASAPSDFLARRDVRSRTARSLRLF